VNADRFGGEADATPLHGDCRRRLSRAPHITMDFGATGIGGDVLF
jgi:hypothetical protein